MAAKEHYPDPVDIHVGQRVRMRRIQIGMSQVTLAKNIGVTFPQVQKYEKGTNRMGASCLYQVCEVLEVPIAFLFEGLPNTRNKTSEPAVPKYLTEFMGTTQGQRIIESFCRISDKQLRNDLARLMETTANCFSPSTKPRGRPRMQK
jgi:transcriptional regulator with XRE-family HTH domain